MGFCISDRKRRSLVLNLVQCQSTQEELIPEEQGELVKRDASPRPYLMAPNAM